MFMCFAYRVSIIYLICITMSQSLQYIILSWAKLWWIIIDIKRITCSECRHRISIAFYIYIYYIYKQHRQMRTYSFWTLQNEFNCGDLVVYLLLNVISGVVLIFFMTEMNVNVEIIFYSCLYYQWNPPKQTVPSELFGKKRKWHPTHFTVTFTIWLY